MKPIYAHLGGALALSFTIAACVPSPDSTPAPTPTPTMVPVEVVPAPAPAAPPVKASWIDEPQTPGTWRLSGNQAAFVTRDSTGGTTAPSAPLFIAECRGNAVRLMSRTASNGAAMLTIRTETATRAVTLSPVSRNSDIHFGAIDLQPRDPLLDAMALTRGRFAVETVGLAPLYLPAWAELTRVIEDCR